jgi:hypothetical protein
MSHWVSLLVAALIVMIALLGLFLLLTALLHVRGDVGWMGMWTGGAALPHETSIRIEYGFPGFMQAWTHEPSADDAGAQTETPNRNPASSSSSTASRAASSATAQPSPSSPPSPFSPSPERRTPAEAPDFSGVMKSSGGMSGATTEASPPTPERATHTQQGTSTKTPKTRAAKKQRDPHRYRKALFHFVTDGTAWAVLSGYGLRVLCRALRLPRVRIDLSAGHPDPAFLGRMAGRWYAVSPLLPQDRVCMAFRFQDRHPSFGVRVRGAFSLLGLLWFCVTSLLTFPLLRLGRRGWHGWRNRSLTGWRGRLYRKIQTIDI